MPFHLSGSLVWGILLTDVGLLSYPSATCKTIPGNVSVAAWISWGWPEIDGCVNC